MKILHLVSGNDIGGALTHIVTLLGALSKKHEVKLLCLESGANYRAALECGIDAVSLGQRNRYDLSVIRKITDIARAGNYDLLHCHGARANFVAVKLKKHLRIPIATTIHSDYRHDFDHNRLKKLLFTYLNVRALKKIDYYLCVTNKFREDFIERGFDKKKIKVVYNGVVLPRQQGQSADRSSDGAYGSDIAERAGTIKIGCVSRLHPIKGVEVLIKAAALLKKRLGNSNADAPNVEAKPFSVLIAGSGSEEARLKKLVNDLQLEDCVQFLGFIHDVSSFYKSIDINVLTSYSESFPYALLEGGLHTLPTVASRVGGIPEMIRDKVDGMLFTSGDEADLADKILTLISDPSKAYDMARSFKKRICSEFSADAMAETHEKIYREILTENPKQLAICGYYGYQNSGDDAILHEIVGMVNHIRTSSGAPVKITVLSKTPEATAREYGVDAVGRFNIFEVIKLFKRVNMLVMGGGSLLQDRSSNRSLYYYLSVIKLAKWAGAKVALIANGIGPISSRFNMKLTASVLRRIELITVRERFSYNFLKEMGVDIPGLHITGDPVFLTEAGGGDCQKIFRDENILPNEDYVCVMFRSWKNEDRYARAVAEICDSIVEKYGCKIVFVPMRHPADVRISQRIASNMRNSGIVVSGRYTPQEIIGFMSRARLTLGMRLHAIIYSAIARVPFVAFNYDPKIVYYSKELEMPLVDDLADIDVSDVMRAVNGLLQKRDESVEILVKNTEIIRSNAAKNQEYMEQIL